MKLTLTHYTNSLGFSIEAELTEAQVQALALRGLKAITGGTMPAIAKKYLGVEKLPKGFEGGSIPFDTRSAALLTAELESLTLDDSKLAVVVTSTHPYLNTADKARASAKLAQWESADVLERHLNDKCGYDGDTHGGDGEFHPLALAAVHKLIEEALAALN